MSRKSKKGTPEGVDELINRREIIGEEAYTNYWKRLNRARRESQSRFEQEGQLILAELLRERSSPIFKGKGARERAIEERKRGGGYIVKRDASGRFSKRGRTYQVIRRKAK